MLLQIKFNVQLYRSHDQNIIMASSLRPETEDSGDSMESDELSQVHDSPSCQSVMFYLPEVTHHILKHLPMRSLNTSAR